MKSSGSLLIAAFALLVLPMQAELTAAPAKPVPFSGEQVRLQIFLDQAALRSRKDRRASGGIHDQGAEAVSAREWTAGDRRRRRDSRWRQIDPLYTTYEIRPEDAEVRRLLADEAAGSGEAEVSAVRIAARVSHGAISLRAGTSRENQSGGEARGAESGRRGERAECRAVQDRGTLANRRAAGGAGVSRTVITIDTREKMLDLREGDKLLASLPITPGSDSLPTPPGKWRIVGIAQMPTFRWDKSVLMTGCAARIFTSCRRVRTIRWA